MFLTEVFMEGSSSKLINVGDKFRSHISSLTKAVQPADYVAYPQGAKKIGLICQDGLAKRKADIESFKTRIATAYIVKGGSTPVTPSQSVGQTNVVLSTVDKFFSWLNKVIGE